jgi:uncharacterized iron-regulated membrane protein
MSSIRLWHTYLGILIAPSVLFFALTGALQIFNLHEAHGSYKPPPLLEKLSSVHKDQVFEQKHDEPPAAGAANDEHEHPPPQDHAGPSLGTVLLKWFFLLVALALATSTLLGLWMGLTHPLRKRTGWWLLAIGTLVPIVLIII